MLKYKLFVLSISIFLLLYVSGCVGIPADMGFGARSYLAPFIGAVASPYSPQKSGFYVSDLPGGSQGSVQSFTSGNTHSHYVVNGQAPANWQMGHLANAQDPCSLKSKLFKVYQREYTDMICVGTGFRRFNMTPNELYANATNNITIATTDLSDSYGLPLVSVYNYATGDLVDSSIAQSFNSSEPSMQGVVYLSQVYAGNYTIIVSNKTATGDYEDIGGATVYVNGPPDPCGTEAQSECESQDGRIWDPSNCSCRNEGGAGLISSKIRKR